MPDLAQVLGYQYLTGVIQKFRFPEYWFVNQVPEEPIQGDIAKWDIEKAIIEVDNDFTYASGEAQPIPMGIYGTRSQRMPVTFKFKALDPGILSQLRRPGTDTRDTAGQAMVTRESASMQRRFGSYLEEYMLSQALTGTLTIKINGVSTSIDYGVPSSHKPTAVTSWATTSTNLLTDITAWKRLIVKDTGMTPRWAICNQTVMNMLIRNTDIQTYMGSTAFGIQVAENGYLVRFHGLTWIVLDHHYAQPGATERFDTPFIADNYLFILPDFSQEWISLQRGTIVIPNTAKTDVIDMQGPAMWTRIADSPTGVVIYYKNARLPAVRNPNAIVYAKVIP